MAGNSSLLTGLAVALLVLAAAAPLVSAAKECGPKCTARFTRMEELRKSNNIIRINPELFKELIRTGPRNYSVVLLLNAENPKRGCQPCM